MSKPKKLTRLQIIENLKRELEAEREETKFLRTTLCEIKQCLLNRGNGKKKRVKLALLLCEKGLEDAVSRFMRQDSERLSANIVKTLLQPSPFMELIERRKEWTSTSTSGL